MYKYAFIGRTIVTLYCMFMKSPMGLKIDAYILLYLDRGWVGWRNDKRDFVEIIFEFDKVREFHSIQVYCNNQFTKEVAVFSHIKAFFSVGGKVYGEDSVDHAPLPDQIFEEPKNVSVNLNRRVGRFLRVELYFASKWLLISEVSFDSSVARGNYTVEEVEGATNEAEGATREVQQEGRGVTEESPTDHGLINLTTPGKEGELSLMPIIVGALTTVIILLAAIIFFIVSRSRQGKEWIGKSPVTENTLTSEKVALNPNEPIHYSYFVDGPVSESASNSGSRSGGGSRKVPPFDDNYNSSGPVFGSPRTGVSRQGSCGTSPATRRATPLSTPRLGSSARHTPQRRIINNPMSEMPMYMEPYHVMRYSPYVCGPADIAVCRETAILSGNRFGSYNFSSDPDSNPLQI